MSSDGLNSEPCIPTDDYDTIPKEVHGLLSSSNMSTNQELIDVKKRIEKLMGSGYSVK